MLDDKLSYGSDSPSQTTVPPTVITKTFGVWKFWTVKETFAFKPLLWTEWNKYTSTIPHIYRLMWDVYNLNPRLVLLYFASRAWKGVEPGINMYVSSQLYVELEVYLREGTGNPRNVIKAIVAHLLCVMISSLSSTAYNHFVPKLTSQAELFFEEHLMKENLRYDVLTLSHIKTGSRPNAYMGWYCFAEVIQALVGILGLFTLVTSILYQHHGGSTFTILCLIYPLVGRVAKYQWTQGQCTSIKRNEHLTVSTHTAMVIMANNKDYLRLKGFGSLSNSYYREDVVNNNLAGYIVREYRTSRERLGTLFSGNPMSQVHVENSMPYQLLRAMSGEMPVLYFTCIALLDPASHSMSSLAILRQQSSALTGSITTTFETLAHILYTLETIKSLYHQEPLRLVDGTIEYQPPKGSKGLSLKLRDVSFTYPGSKSKDGAIKNVSLEIKAGQLVVIVGANGSGKSTLIKLLTRTYDPTSGEIIVDGSVLQSYKVASLRDSTAIFNQDHAMYPFSLAENIGLGYSACATDRDMINAAVQKGGASEVIAGLKEGLETNLEPVETAFSFGIDLPRHQALQDILDDLEMTAKVSGEKQRLVASRTFMRLQNPNIKLVAVDEPSSALDPRGELELFNSLRSEQNGRTMIFVTHRFGHLTKHADLIVCMKNGEVIEAGSHRDLLALNGEYATLYNIQAQAFSSDQTHVVGVTTTPPYVNGVDVGNDADFI
ncbi:hypothetical protein H0H87_004696 [Tephrocybe sp. NHM501043]|nr:hypothetical protein H0H87_004696 [Tephrocybe sp. NHM501043]